MTTTTRHQRRYDHRLREFVRASGSIDVATRYGVPQSTARGWLQADDVEVHTIDILNMDMLTLQQEVIALRERVQRLLGFLRLLTALIKVFGVTLANTRLADGKDKRTLLRAIEHACKVIPLETTLRTIGINPSRYYAWKSHDTCALDDLPSCPRICTQQLTGEEIQNIKEMVTSQEYRHVSTSRLAILAQRLGKVFASSGTWLRLVRLHEWRCPRKRIHPSKPKDGIRAKTPNEIWHVDATVIRLLDGSRVYLHAIIDNFSRRILAWKVAKKLDVCATAELVLIAAKGLDAQTPMLLTDGGVENINGSVNELIEQGVMKRVLAQTEITYSNSLIESWWRVLKHYWLFLNTLDTINSVEKLVSFYINAHNTELPHSAFQGQTPDEMYFGTGDHIPAELEQSRKAARKDRIEKNRNTTCSTCQPTNN